VRRASITTVRAAAAGALAELTGTDRPAAVRAPVAG
jgi:hypothetical protein